MSEPIEVESCDKSDCFTGSVILTPNNDGYNEFFLLKCAEDLIGNYLYVYNRLGTEVYKQGDYDGTWTGLDKDGIPLPEDGYLWVFIGKNEAGINEVFKGSVTILR
jgi:gliding motility-associated-like protein